MSCVYLIFVFNRVHALVVSEMLPDMLCCVQPLLLCSVLSLALIWRLSVCRLRAGPGRRRRRRRSPRTTTTADVFEVGKDVCDKTRADTSIGRMDDKIVDVVANANATAAKARMLYVTRFTTHFDDTCTLKAGDAEIFGLDITAAVAKIQPVSANRAPITDTDLPSGTAPCVL